MPSPEHQQLGYRCSRRIPGQEVDVRVIVEQAHRDFASLVRGCCAKYLLEMRVASGRSPGLVPLHGGDNEMVEFLGLCELLAALGSFVLPFLVDLDFRLALRAGESNL